MVRVSRPRWSTSLAVPSRAVLQARWRVVSSAAGAASGRCRPGADLGERGPRGVLTEPIPSAGQDLDAIGHPDTSPRASTKSPACAADTRPSSRPRQPSLPA
jgi:hypothetical protein